jgi:hypothetical protein
MAATRLHLGDLDLGGLPELGRRLIWRAEHCCGLLD